MLPLKSRLPLLITGINGVAGYNALHYFQRRYPGQVIGVRPWKFGQPDMVGVYDMPIEDAAELRELFERYRFQSVISCAGNCALKSCELDPAMATRLNVTSVETVLANVRAFGSRLVHLSSDLVYSGVGQGNYVETDPIDPVTVYGKTMGQAENLIEKELPETAILRISLPMGPSPNRHAGAIDWIDSRFRNGRPATLYFDEVRSCTYCDDLNPVFERFLTGEESGVFHLGGPRASTLYQIGQIVNRVGGYAPRLLRGHPRIDAWPIPPRAGNVTMNSDKLVRLLATSPFRPWPAASELWPADRLWHFDRACSDRGSFAEIKRCLCQPGSSPQHLAESA